MKAQMFIVTMIFLVGLIFLVQQSFFGYTYLDLSEPFREDEYPVISNIKDSMGEILAVSSSCQEAEENLHEFVGFAKKESLQSGYELEIDYELECPSRRLTVNIDVVQGSISTKGAFRFP